MKTQLIGSIGLLAGVLVLIPSALALTLIQGGQQLEIRDPLPRPLPGTPLPGTPLPRPLPGFPLPGVPLPDMLLQGQSSSLQQQQTTVTLQAANLDEPHMLTVYTAGTQLSGEIRLDGEVIRSLKANRESIDLAPYLSVGDHTIEISANYSPGSASIGLELVGPGTSVMQQSSGSGVLRQTVVIRVE